MSLLLDLTRAKEFAQEPEQLQQLLVTFEHSLAQELLELDAAFTHGNTQKAEHALHALKGFLPMFTGDSLGASVINLYAQSRQQPFEATKSQFTTLVPNLELLLSQVRDRLSPL
jgi:HPt (histidine-containing phosphotransfer) domain-containing protein